MERIVERIVSGTPAGVRSVFLWDRWWRSLPRCTTG
jgi:hypothetical protein